MRYRSTFAVLVAMPLAAQMPPMDHSHMNMSMPGMESMNPAGIYLMQMASGTSMNPQSWRMPMLAPKLGSWNTMVMGQAFLVDTQQSGPRGGDKFYSPNWFMLSAEHKLGNGSLMLQSMISLDPATVTGRQYPLLFQTGETAFGKPLSDAQHPHDFIMSIGVHYAHPLGENTMLQLFYAPVGDPALGPIAFPHRASAAELPEATLGHHWQDSSHIANNVATVALKHKWVRLEASGFYGSEPNENRWNIDWGPMNSWSARASVMPSPNWLAQVSVGRLTQPERQEHGDVVRTTASVHYTRPIAGRGGWSSSLIWGRNHSTETKRGLDSWTAETLYPITQRDFFTARAERVSKDELAVAEGVFPIQAYTAGYTRDFPFFRPIEAGIGANVTGYAIPQAIQPFYGEHPWGVNVYLRFRLRPPA